MVSSILSNKSDRIFLIGFMGCGKSYWGKLWASANKYDYVDLDDAVVAYAGEPIALVGVSSA